MYFSFTPKRLMEAANDIVLLHKKQREVVNYLPSDRLRELIERVVALELYQVKKNAYVLSEDEVLQIAGYLPHNYYGVDMKNLFLVCNYRSTSEVCKILFEQWQSAYDNKQCNQYMREQLQVNEDFIILMHGHHLGDNLFDDVLKSDSIPTRIGLECVGRTFPKGYSFLDKMNYFGIQGNTRLYHDTLFLFYTFCNKEDYLSAIKTELLAVIQRYNEGSLKAFLYRFLEFLSLTELESFFDMARYFLATIGDVDSNKGKKFFSDATKEVKEKYRDWLIRIKINEYFGNDERSRFWKQFQFKSVVRYGYSNSVLMEFEEYFAIEFLGKSMGPIYIYRKETFEKYIRRWMRSYNNGELRQKLFHNENLYFRREEHRGYWQGKVKDILLRYSITETLKW